MKTIQEKIERMDLTMARRPKGNYEAMYRTLFNTGRLIDSSYLVGGRHRVQVKLTAQITDLFSSSVHVHQSHDY